MATTKYIEAETLAPKIMYGNCRLTDEEAGFLQREHLTFSEFTHRAFIRYVNEKKQSKLSHFANCAITMIIGLGLLSVSTLEIIPYPVRLILGTVSVSLVFIGAILSWQAFKAI
jgi:hypothetical protein